MVDRYTCTGLKTLISDVPEAFGTSVAQRLTIRLLGGVDQEKTVSGDVGRVSIDICI